MEESCVCERGQFILKTDVHPLLLLLLLCFHDCFHTWLSFLSMSVPLDVGILNSSSIPACTSCPPSSVLLGAIRFFDFDFSSVACLLFVLPRSPAPWPQPGAWLVWEADHLLASEKASSHSEQLFSLWTGDSEALLQLSAGCLDFFYSNK